LKLIIEPDDGVAPLLSAIKNAKKSVEIVIFRFDRADVEAALKAAVANGARVTALIANANRGGEKNLRKLELSFLEAGIIVARTDDDLIRYHDKFMVVDRRSLYMLSFNFTHLDIDHSRGFGIVTHHAKWVRQAVDLLRADCTRNPYELGMDTFVVSPINSRKVLARFLKRAKKELLIYDPKISDDEMLHILEDRAKAGVAIRVIGRLTEEVPVSIRKLAQYRLHTRTIIRDRHQAFVGSQSLRPAELDSRRELGLIVRDPQVVKKLLETFESDWAAAEAPEESDQKKEKNGQEEKDPSKEAAPADPEEEKNKVVRVLVQELQPLTTTVKKAVRKAVAEAGEEVVKDKVVKATVRKVVKKAVKEAVKEAVQDAKEA